MKRYTKSQLDRIDKSICQPLREMTENNQHTDAVVFLADKLFECRAYSDDPDYCVTLYDSAHFIKREHDRMRHMPYTLMHFRAAILEDIQIQLATVFQNGEIESMIHKAL